jgi:hypothetical protein
MPHTDLALGQRIPSVIAYSPLMGLTWWQLYRSFVTVTCVFILYRPLILSLKVAFLWKCFSACVLFLQMFEERPSLHFYITVTIL